MLVNMIVVLLLCILHVCKSKHSSYDVCLVVQFIFLVYNFNCKSICCTIHPNFKLYVNCEMFSVNKTIINLRCFTVCLGSHAKQK